MNILHVWSEFKGDAETERRKALAKSTWGACSPGNWIGLPLMEPRRDSRQLGDIRPMPFIRDVIEHAFCAKLADADIIALTNADVCFTPGLTGWILDAVPRHGAAFTHRWDFARLDKPLVNEAQVRRGKWYPGSDAFFFTVGWWKAHRDEYPDMILGRVQWDEVFRQLVKRHGGVEIQAAIYHEYHESAWGDGSAQAGNRHNQKLARQWFRKTGLRELDPIWWQIKREPAQEAWVKKHLSK